MFADGTDHRCSDAPEGWDDLDTEEINRRRAAYAVRVFTNVRDRIGELVDAWAEGRDDNFRAAFENAGENTSIFGSAQEAVDELFAALFYVELRTKDDKLACPRASTWIVQTHPCPEEVESPFASYSLELILANLEGMRAAFRGTANEGEDGVGFDDFLRAEMQQSLPIPCKATSMLYRCDSSFRAPTSRTRDI